MKGSSRVSLLFEINTSPSVFSYPSDFMVLLKLKFCLFLYLVCVCADVVMYHSTHNGSHRTILGSWFSVSMRILGIELRLFVIGL